MSGILAIDAGTTGVTALIVDEEGEVRSRGYREFAQHFPRPGWVEHDPNDWWDALGQATEEALGSAAMEASALTAIGITNQRETTVLWDRESLEPVHPAIVWQDRRTAPLCEALRNEGWEERVRDRTGLVIDPYFSGTKVAWILEHVEGAADAARAGRLAFGTVDSYVIARLSGARRHVTDRTNASRTMLFDIHRLAWDEEILERLEIPRALLPEVLPSAAPFATTESDAFFGAEVPVLGVAGDQQAALFGEACFEPGATKNTYGTGSFVLMNTGAQAPTSKAGLITTAAASPTEDPVYALEGSIFVTGAALQWLRDGLGIIGSAAEAGPLAETVPDSGDVYFVPALTGLGAPWWDPYARGLLVGITRGTTRAHLVRAAVEAMAYQTRDVIEAMRSDAGLPLTELKADGGASAMDVMLQLQADLLGVPVRRPMIQETTALGAAYLAGLQAGVWGSLGELSGRWRADREFSPGNADAADHGYRRWLEAVERARGWASSE
ncbi:MAG TPA: glycerol kinase GlpK [Actinomycetota bacterium]|nr:glycerol kinase GlpK [Actinomycetota bacterium]